MGESDELEAGLRAAFGGRTSDSVLDRLAPGGRRLKPVVLRDEPESATPVATPRGPATEGRYQVVGEIARGGVGVVLKGRDVDLGRDVAMKFLRDEYRENEDVQRRFVEEAQIGGQLQHPGIVPVYELGLDGKGNPYFTMKLVKGRTLAALLGDRADPGEERRRYLSIFESVCQTMAYAHARGVIHRDLKPANVMVGSFGEVLVVDWGIGKVLRQGGTADEKRARKPDLSVIATVRSDSHGSESVVGSIMGTPRYMPPEQARGEVERMDERSDVFALGAILCEILTGDPPYRGDGAEVVRDAAAGRLDETLTRIDACGADAPLAALARQCLAPAPSARPRSAAAVAKEIGAYLASVEARARDATLAAAEARVKVAEERRRRKLSLALAASVVALVVVGGGGWVAMDASRRNRAAETGRAVAEALDEATLLRGRAEVGDDPALRREAVSAAKRADALAQSGDADADTRAKATQVLTQLESEERAAGERADRRAADEATVRRLEDIRMARSEHWNHARTEREYAEAFGAMGIDADVPPAEGAAAATAEKLSASAIRSSLVTALHDWRSLRIVLGRPVAALDADLDVVDPDPLRRRIRAARTLADVQQLAASKEIDEAPDATLLLLAKRLGRHRDAAAAAKLALRVRTRSPGDYWANVAAGEWCRESRPPLREEEVRSCMAAAALRPTSWAARINLGAALRSSGDTDGALTQFREAARLAPREHKPHTNIALTLLDRFDAEGALAAAREALRIAPEDPLSHYAVGTALLFASDVEEALTAFREGIRLGPGYPDCHMGLADALLVKGDFDGAIAACREVLRLAPTSAQARACLGTALLNKHRLDGAAALDGALAECREAVRLDPGLDSVHTSLGLVLRERGALDEALVEHREAVRLRPGSAAAHDGLGVCLFMKGSVDEALREHREAVRLFPRSPGFRCNLGIALQRSGDLQGALAELREAVRIQPADATVQVNLADMLLRAGDVGGAVAAAQEAVRLQPGDALAHSNLSVVYRQQGELDKSIAAAREAIRLSPAWAGGHINLAVVLDDKGDLDESLAVAREAIRLEPDEPIAHMNLSNTLRRKGETAASLAPAREAVRLAPGNADARKGLGEILRASGELEAAVVELREAIRLDPRCRDAHLTLGYAFQRMGRLKEAAETFRAGVVEGMPEEASAQLLALASRTEARAALEPRLPAVLEGREEPATPAEAAEFAMVAYYLGLNAGSAGLYSTAIGSSRDPAEIAGWRFDAACSAALAASGAGKDAAKVDPAQRSRWCLQALEWLRADLDAIVQSGAPAPVVRNAVGRLLRDRDLGGIREPDAIAARPAADAESCRTFWRDALEVGRRAR